MKDTKTGKQVSDAAAAEVRRQAQRTDLPEERKGYWQRLRDRLTGQGGDR